LTKELPTNCSGLAMECWSWEHASIDYPTVEPVANYSVVNYSIVLSVVP
jgi:hypothetical protein